MDSTADRPRDMVYCHQCENEWFRDEHGLVCPSCQGDFTEIIESTNDPRSNDHFPDDTDTNFTDPVDGRYGDFYAPDPDEDDIEELHLRQTGPDTLRLSGTYRTEIPIGPDGRPQSQEGQEQAQGGWMNLLGNVIQSAFGGQHEQQTQQQRQGDPASQWPVNLMPQDLSRGGGSRTIVHQGPGFHLSISTSNTNFGRGLSPRNADGPQPFQPQPDHIEQMMSQILGNIMPGQRGFIGIAGPGGVHTLGNEEGFEAGGPFMMHGGGIPGQPMRGINLANLFQFFGGPPGGVAGDAVYSQEALDRIITQLMEQHQAGNAPGPASEAAIKALPTKTISEADQGDSGKAECSICMDEVPLGEMVTTLPCQHWFHADCIHAWLSEHDTCPHCRQGIMPKDGDANSSTPRRPNQEPRHDMHSPEYTRPSPPGGYPFPRQDSMGSTSGAARSGDGSQQNPFILRDSPTLTRQSSASVERRRSSGNASGGGVFSRMRDAFGGGSAGGSNAGRT